MPILIENDKYRFELEFGSHGCFEDKTTNECVYKEWEELKHPDGVLAVFDFLSIFLNMLHKIAISDCPEEFPQALRKRLFSGGASKDSMQQLLAVIIEMKQEKLSA